MKKSMTRFIIVIAAIFAALTVVAFAVPFTKNGTFWVAYIFALLALAAQVYAYPKAFAGESARSKFYGFPIARISTVYLIVQVILSIIFMAVAKFVPAWIPAVLFIVMLCAAVIGFVSADAVRDEVERQDVQLKRDVTAMRALQSKANMLSGQLSGEAGKALDKLADAIRYSDPVSGEALEEIETELSAELDELQKAVVDGDTDAVLTLCRKATATLAERNRLCKLNK